MDMRELATAVTGRLHGAGVRFANVSTDTRTLARDDLFVALKGPSFDGHDFVDSVRDRAAGVVASRHLPAPIPQVIVDDTQRALGSLGGYWRQKFSCPLIAVTGSNGKTTVKEMIGAILGGDNEGLVGAGNLNNAIGVPLVLCRLRARHRYAVVEMGMNHAGEIDYLTQLARPDVAVITNAGAAHLEGLGDVASVARAKAEIFNGLSAGGTAVINVDDPHYALWRRLAGDRRVITFGIAEAADIRATRIEAGQRGAAFTVTTLHGDSRFTLNLPGRHNVSNALAAIGAAMAVDADLDRIRAGLAGMQPVAGRLTPYTGRHGARVMDDSYNANPASMMAGIDVLTHAGQSILIMGDMGELGAGADDFHQQIGRYARRAGIGALYALGPLSRKAVEAYGPGARHFESPEDLIDAVTPLLAADLTILVKGSRAMRMERIVSALLPGEDS